MEKYSNEDIERYVMGDMPDEERHAFEEEVAADADLAREVRFIREVIASLRLSEEQVADSDRVRSALRDLEKTLPEIELPDNGATKDPSSGNDLPGGDE